MDPDQAADAGVQHDDLGDSAAPGDWCCDCGGDGSWARTLLRRGWDLSRKAAIASVAATAAPVVAPLLLVLSVAGVAMSLPFAAYLASIAATDRLMGALLPPPRAQPYQTCDPEDDEFLDAQEAARDEVPAVDYWGETEDGASREENKRYASLPLLCEPRLSEAPVPASGDEEDTMAEDEFHFQELGHESFVFDNGVQKEQGTSNQDYEYITTEALPRGFDFPGSMLRDEDNMSEGSVEAPVAAVESIQQLSLPDSGDKTDGGKGTARKEMESSDDMLSPGVEITEFSIFKVPALGIQDFVVQREVEGENSVRKSGLDSHLPDIGDKTEEIPLQEVDVSESLAPDNIMLRRKTEGDATVEMVVEEVTMNTTPVTGEVAHEQMDSITTAMPESGSLKTSDLVAHELQEAAYVDDILETTSTEDIVLDVDDTNIESLERHGEGGISGVITKYTVKDTGDTDTGDMEHHGEGDVSSVFSLVTLDDVMDLVSSRTRSTTVSGISDDVTSVESRPDHHCNQTTCCPTTNKKLLEKEIAEEKHVKIEENKSMDKLPTSSMEQQNIDVYESPVPDNERKIEDEVTVPMVLEKMTRATDDLVTGKVVAVQLNIVASESELLSPSDHMSQELLAVNKGAVVDKFEGSTEMEDIIKHISDRNAGGVEHHSDVGTCTFVSGPSEVTTDCKDLIFSRYTPHARGRDGATRDKGMADVDHPDQRAGAEYELVKEISGRNVVAEDKDNYTEEQLREQLDILRTITGYRSPVSSTLEAELSGIYIFVGVELPVSSRDTSHLNELNAKLWFLKSIIGVE